MAEIVRYIEAKEDDHSRVWATPPYTEYWSNDNPPTYAIGYGSVCVPGWFAYVAECMYRFTNITIPQNSTINSATLTIKGYEDSGVDAEADIQACDEDNSTQVINFTDFGNRPRTTASVLSTLRITGGTPQTLEDIKSVIQEVVDRPGWSSGNAIQIILSDHDYKYPSFPPSADNDVQYPLEYGGYTSILTINYTIPYIDIGVRVKGSASIIKIAGETLTGSHKVRFRKGNTTYGIPLVATNDENASPIRVYDGSGVKALRKLSS